MSRLTALIALAALLVGAAVALLLAGSQDRTVTKTKTMAAKQAMEAVGPVVAHVRVHETDSRLNPPTRLCDPPG